MLVVLLVVSFTGTLNACEKGKCLGCDGKLAKDAKFKAEYKGHTIPFCSEKCKAAFEKDPAKFVAKCKCKCKKTAYVCPKEGCKHKADKAGKCPTCKMDLVKHEAKVKYACPMKQCKINTDKPGKCPKCGMKLKKVAACKHDHKGHDHKGHDHDHKH